MIYVVKETVLYNIQPYKTQKLLSLCETYLIFIFIHVFEICKHTGMLIYRITTVLMIAFRFLFAVFFFKKKIKKGCSFKNGKAG